MSSPSTCNLISPFPALEGGAPTREDLPFIADELLLLIFKSLSLPQVVKASITCRRWHQVAHELLPPQFLRNLIRTPGKILGSPGHYDITNVICSKSHVAYTMKQEPNLFSDCNSIVALHDLATNQPLFYTSPRVHDYFLSLNSSQLRIGGNEWGGGKYIGVSLCTYPLGQLIPAHKIDCDDAFACSYKESADKQLIAMVSMDTIPVQFHLIKEQQILLQIPLAIEGDELVRCLDFIFLKNHLRDHLLVGFQRQMLCLYELQGGSRILSLNLSPWLEAIDDIDKIAANAHCIAIASKHLKILFFSAQTFEFLGAIDLKKEERDLQEIGRPQLKQLGVKELQLQGNLALHLSANEQLTIFDLQQQKIVLSLPASAIASTHRYLFVAVPNEPQIQLWDLKSLAKVYHLYCQTAVGHLHLYVETMETNAKIACLVASLARGQVQVWHSIPLKEEPFLSSAYHSLSSHFKWLKGENRVRFY